MPWTKKRKTFLRPLLAQMVNNIFSVSWLSLDYHKSEWLGHEYENRRKIFFFFCCFYFSARDYLPFLTFGKRSLNALMPSMWCGYSVQFYCMPSHWCPTWEMYSTKAEDGADQNDKINYYYGKKYYFHVVRYDYGSMFTRAQLRAAERWRGSRGECIHNYDERKAVYLLNVPFC